MKAEGANSPADVFITADAGRLWRADPAKYRPKGELEEWMKRDPIKIYRERLKEFGIADEEITAIETESKRKLDIAVENCKAAPNAPKELLTTDVYADGGWAWRN